MREKTFYTIKCRFYEALSLELDIFKHIRSLGVRKADEHEEVGRLFQPSGTMQTTFAWYLCCDHLSLIKHLFDAVDHPRTRSMMLWTLSCVYNIGRDFVCNSTLQVVMQENLLPKS